MNVFAIGAITKGSEGEKLAAIGSMKAAGVVAISDDGRLGHERAGDASRHGVGEALDLPVINHCEDLNLSAGGDMHEGVRVDALSGCAASRPHRKT